MAHFARLNEDNIVTSVHFINNDVITVNGVESELAGINFLTELYKHSKWVQTSYNGKFRKNYAGVGYTYDYLRQAFIPPKTYGSWKLNEETCIWEAPIPKPTEPGRYEWNELNLTWFKLDS